MKRLVLLFVSIGLISACEESPAERARSIAKLQLERNEYHAKRASYDLGSKRNAETKIAQISEELADKYLSDSDFAKASEEFYVSANFYREIGLIKRALQNYDNAIQYGENMRMKWSNETIVESAFEGIAAIYQGTYCDNRDAHKACKSSIDYEKAKGYLEKVVAFNNKKGGSYYIANYELANNYFLGRFKSGKDVSQGVFYMNQAVSLLNSTGMGICKINWEGKIAEMLKLYRAGTY